MEYYQRIRNAREDRDLKQYEFAVLLGVRPKTYNLYENGFRALPIPTLNQILFQLNLSLDYILGLSELKNYPNLKEINTELLHQNIRQIRKNKNMSQKQMANLLNCNQQTLSEYEQGHLTMPLLTLKTFCKITEISADTVAGRTNEIRLLKMMQLQE